MKDIVVVDDEKIISISLQRILARAGYRVTVANNGLDAIQVLQGMKSVDLMFIDLLMPEIGGAEVLDFAKKKFPQVKALMMTAYGDSNVKEDLIRRGAAKVLAKPFDDITQIPDLVKEMLN